MGSLGDEGRNRRAWIVMVPFPALGHLTPMVLLSRALLRRYGGSLRPIITVPAFIYRRMFAATSDEEVEVDGVVFARVQDGFEADAADGESFPRFGMIEDAMENHMPTHFDTLLSRLDGGGTGGGVACVVVDLLASWAIEIAGRQGVPVAGFWPAMLATCRMVWAIPEMIQNGIIDENGSPLRESTTLHEIINVPPTVTTKDLPWLVGNKAIQTSRFNFWLRTLVRVKPLRWLVANSFAGEDDYNSSPPRTDIGLPRIFQVAPLATAAEDHGGDATSKRSGKKKNPSFWVEDGDCMDWLAQQQPSSVIYVSFGSWVGPVGTEKVREIALGLEASGKPFLWVLRDADSWRRGLPDDFIRRTRGKVVGWAPQREVLGHPAVSCYLTHCGWNSTMEAIQYGTRLLCYPISGDQFVNCAYIVSAWKVGVELGRLERGCVEEGVRRVMDDGEELGRRMAGLRAELFGKEGSGRARSSLEDFVAGIRVLGGEGESLTLMSSL